MTQPNDSGKIEVGDLVVLNRCELGLVVRYVEEFDSYRVYVFERQRIFKGFYRGQLEVFSR